MAAGEDSNSMSTPLPAPATGGLFVSAQMLMDLTRRMERIDGKLDQALALPSMVNDLTQRVIALEQERAVQRAKGGVYGKVWEIGFGLLLAFIAAGVWWPLAHH
jgi:hypothetical protein